MKNRALLLLGIIGISLVGGGLFYAINTPSKPLCQKEVVCFDKVFGSREERQTLSEALQNLEIRYKLSFVPSKYMQSRLEHHFDMSQFKKLNQDIFGKENTDSQRVLIQATLYENDKLDPNKKGKKCKLYAGYLLYEFLVDGRLLYKIQIDIMESDGSDIARRIQCIHKSLLYNVER